MRTSRYSGAVGADDEAVEEVREGAGLERDHVPPPHRVHRPVGVRFYYEDLADPVLVRLAQAVLEDDCVAFLELVEVVEDEAAAGVWEAEPVSCEVDVLLTAFFPAPVVSRQCSRSP